MTKFIVYPNEVTDKSPFGHLPEATPVRVVMDDEEPFGDGPQLYHLTTEQAEELMEQLTYAIYSVQPSMEKTVIEP